ncbi:bifunctional 3-oxoadipate enol-lactonase/4-carboxymuconolactone decarboxylase PcaDC [Falsiroseomonas oryzae]|uniref:bifunctional 3-oxoadipate enol-lactonase/4-carboxymuconolactone decarboxylase PcaDC n=1 Tax=Falsiroseomonas oryzae TaxID=2766473 RepID=UPI0022EB175F|nr:4-carboxymuconolactone decarboxylase [Roseomonas sp. MO-31]
MFLHLGDIVVHAQVEGPPPSSVAPPVLMLHSIGTTLHVFDPQAASLARNRRVIRMDLRGHGYTGVTPGPYTMSLHAQDALALLDALGVERAHVVGLSIGGRIALQMAAEAPDRVASLLLMDTAAEFPPPEAWQQRIDTVLAQGCAALVDTVMPRWVCDPSLASSHGLRRMLLNTDPQGYAGSAAALRDARAADIAGRIACPTTVVVGDRDIATPPAMAEALRDMIPGARLVTIPEGAHLPTLECAEAATAAIAGHLAQFDPQPGAEGGMAIRRSVLGEAHVARAQANVTPFDAAFQDWITANVWGGVWTRPGLPRHTRSLLTLAMMAALGRHEEFELHVKATRNTGVTPEELSEVLLQVGAYAGVPAANSAIRIAKRILSEDAG